MKKLIVLFCLLILSCDKKDKVLMKDDNTNIKDSTYFDLRELQEYKRLCVEEGNAKAFGNLVDYYYNTPSKYYELLPISIIMADKYNNDNARVSIYYQIIMMQNDGKLNDTLFFELDQFKKDFIMSYLIEGVKNQNPGCKSILKKLIKGGVQINNKDIGAQELLE